jgi:peptidoglycan/xylan/chitin deacetylase (PgdA/CDA1 family)
VNVYVRRRLVAAGSLLVVLIAIVIAVSAGASSSTQTGGSNPTAASTNAGRDRHRHRGPHHRATAGSGRPSSTLVTNATPQPSWRPFTGPVPILVYHDLGTPPSSEPYPGLYVSDSDFAAEMRWLHQNGFQAVTLDEVMRAWYHGGTLPAKPIVITFDNGYIPQATFAPSVMSHYGWPGVLNEITEGHLSNARIESLIRIGWEIDSHSLNHPDMTTLTPSAMRYQLVASRQFLQRTFHIPANSFCYPSNKYNAAVLAATQAAGYQNATTENTGYAHSSAPFELNRFEIEGGVSELASDLSQNG